MTARQQRWMALEARVRRQWPEWDPGRVDAAIASGEILVDGRVLSNPGARVRADAPLRHHPPPLPAGQRKLAWAIAHFGVSVRGRTALDVGASTGGFTRAWLEAGAARVFAVDAGHGQLLGSLRQDPRVVNLERTNVSTLGPDVITELVDIVSIDVSYLSLTDAVGQLRAVTFAPGAHLLGLVKPMFELRLATIPDEPPTLELALERAVAGVADAGWEVVGASECPVRGGRGAVEYFIHGRGR